MEKLEISTEYKFQKDGSTFYIVLGEWVKVKLNDGIYAGRLIKVDEQDQCFTLKILGQKVKLKCDEVLDIMPVNSGVEEMNKINYMYNLMDSINNELNKEKREELKVEPGDRVLFVYGYNSGCSIETVERVTPTGRIVLKDDFRTYNFNKYGEQTGCGLADFAGYIRKLTNEQENNIIPMCIHFFEEKRDEITFEQAFEILKILKIINP